MAGMVIYAAVLVALALVLPLEWWDKRASHVLLGIGAISAWRYSWGATNLARSLIYRFVVFPPMRRKADALGDAGMPSHIYLLLTSFRIDTETTSEVYRAAMMEAASCGSDVTMVCSIVEMSDQRLIKQLFERLDMPERVRLVFVRIPGTGKRDAIAQGLRAIAKMIPPEDAVVALIDGDSILEPGLLRGTLPFFKLLPKVDALTTDEMCEVRGATVFRDWYNVRFAQRQIGMSSVALSRRVLTLTGRMSAFRGSVAVKPEFIADVENDAVDHWRLGRIKFLTGDDKSSWYSILKSGREMLYVPDRVVTTIETPPDPDFLRSATVLMRRWFGNMLRTNERALKLGAKPMGLFVWWSIFDQRMSMWTGLIGPTAAIIATLAYGWGPLLLYAYWVLLTRYIQTLGLLTARTNVKWTYPALMYFNQIYGALIKTYIFFRLDQQKWTRQNTVSVRDVSWLNSRVLSFSSWSMHAVAVLTFVSLILMYLGLARNPVSSLAALLP
ncbi:MAG TPA: glycosyltransferase [Phenylobacterium sp.]